jgi:UDP-N-acetylmuramate dehydrogenase
MQIIENKKIDQYTTFKIGGPARYFVITKSEQDIIDAVNFCKNKNLKFFVLGGGSNILVSDNGFDGLVIKIELKGVEYDHVLNRVNVQAGEVWDDFVADSLINGFNGLENLSSIPGTVGASPVQNIGAYGVEVGDLIHEVRVFDTKDSSFKIFSQSDCLFSYRESLFKKEKGRYIITSVTFSLKRDSTINISYKDIQNYITQSNLVAENLKPQDVRDIVIKIRSNKLPDWKKWGTAGSFFKNPIISKFDFENLKKKYPELPGFADGDMVKVSLAWILDNICNARGLCEGNACVYEKHALVLVSKSGATSEEVVSLAHKLIDSVKEKTGISIEGEVEWVN